jgi:hypothetical protein
MTGAVYDGNGLRASMTTPAGTQDYTWDAAGDLLMDSSSAYIYAGGTAPAEQVSLATGTVTYLNTDSLGSVRGIISSTGTLTASTSYDAWGNPQASGGLTAWTPFGYAGAYTDPDGLLYLINRVGGAGQLPGEVAGVGAQRHPPGPGRRGQGSQRAAQQVRRGRARSSVPSPRSAASTISVSAQAATCGRPTRCPWWLQATPRFLRPQTSTSVVSRSMVTGPAASATVRSAGSSASIRPVTAARPVSTARHCPAVIRRARPAAVVNASPAPG